MKAGTRVALTALVACACVLALGPHPGAGSDSLDEFVLAEMGKQHIPGLSMAATRDGAVIVAKGYGHANVELNVPATADTVYELASVSKQFIAAGILQLAEDGRLSIDRPIATYLLDAPDAWTRITVRHLLTHTSGMVRFDPLGLFDAPTEAEMMKAVVGLKLEFEPGERLSYSNVGYNLLALAIERVSGERWDAFLERRIFGPLGMSSTRRLSHADIVPRRAGSYVFDGVLKNTRPTPRALAAGGLLTTAADLAKWDIALGSGAILRRSSLDQMFTPATLADGRPASYSGGGYGFGWRIRTVDGRRVVDHGGSRPGSTTYVARYLDEKLGVIVLTNLDEAMPGPIAAGIVSRVLAESASRSTRK